MQPQTLGQLLETSAPERRFSSGISKLDAALPGKNGFRTGIYDISGTVGYVGLGAYEILFNVVLGVLASKGRVLCVQTTNKFPWLKLQKNRRFRPEYGDQIDCIDVSNLVDVIVLFKSKRFFDPYSMIILDSFPGMYAESIRNMKALIGPSANGDYSEPVIKFYQSARKLFHLMQQVCTNSQHGTMIFTVGPMDIFNQKVLIHAVEDSDYDSTDSDPPDMDAAPKRPAYINQQIFVPTISLKSDLNSYYNGRIIVYRDWVLENANNELVSGLDNKNQSVFENSLALMASGKMKCLPHFLCVTSSPSHLRDPAKLTGFFLVDNNFQVIDIAHTAVNVDADGNFDLEIPDSQE